MAIQWFPGHMHLTRKAIAERIKDIDVVIELLDARLPGSSANPMLAEMTAAKPRLMVLNKQDLTGLPPAVERDEYDRITRVRLSAKRGDGVVLLREALAEIALEKSRPFEPSDSSGYSFIPDTIDSGSPL